jgi:hypothetical protein
MGLAEMLGAHNGIGFDGSVQGVVLVDERSGYALRAAALLLR